MARNVLKINYY